MTDKTQKLVGHLLAAVTITVWGSTFISSKVLLTVLSPVQIMICRFVIAYAVLWLLRPKWDKTSIKDELGFAAMGVFSCTLYFMAENYALRFTLASNVSIIVASAPIMTAVLAHFFTKSEKLNRNILFGFLVAFSGVAMVVLNGKFVLKLNPLGDMLSLLAALSWAVYSVILKKYVGRFNTITLTRKLMFYGLLTSLPIMLVQGGGLPFEAMKEPKMLLNLLFLGILGSGICYVLWSKAVLRLGVVKTNNYIYVNPFVTLLTGAVFLSEPITPMGIFGALLIISGVVICSKKPKALTAE